MVYKSKNPYAQSANNFGEKSLLNWVRKTRTLINNERD